MKKTITTPTKTNHALLLFILIFTASFIVPALSLNAESTKKVDLDKIINYVRRMNTSPEKSEQTIRSLFCSCIEGKRVVSRLIKTLNDPDDKVRMMAAIFLRRFTDPAAVPHLKERAKLEKNKLVLKWIKYALESIENDRTQGTLTFINGWKTPRITNKKPQNETMRLDHQQNNKPLQRISNLIDIRRSFSKNHYEHIIQPFQQPIASMETMEDVFVACTGHLAVYSKKNKQWQIFTSAHGYRPLCGDHARLENFENYIAILGTDYEPWVFSARSACSHVTIFHKKTRVLYELPSKDYPAFRAGCVPVPALAYSAGWQVQGKRIVFQHPGTLKKTVFKSIHGGYNDIRHLCPVNDYLIAVTSRGLRIFKDQKEVKQIDCTNGPNGLYANDIHLISSYKNRFIVYYGENLEIFEVTGEKHGHIKKVQFIPYHGRKMAHLAFDHKNIYWGHGKDFYIHSLAKGHKSVSGRSLSDKIKRMHRFPGSLILETAKNLYTISIPGYEMKKFPLYQTNPQRKTTWYFPLNRYLYGNINTRFGHKRSNEPIFFDTPENKIETDFNKISTADLPWEHGAISFVHGNSRFQLAARGKKSHIYYIYNQQETQTPVYQFAMEHLPPGKNFKRFTRHKNDTFLGWEIKNTAFSSNVMWIYTDTGLHSFNIPQKRWRSHFFAESGPGTSTPVLAVTAKEIHGKQFSISRLTGAVEYSPLLYKRARSRRRRSANVYLIHAGQRRKLGGKLGAKLGARHQKVRNEFVVSVINDTVILHDCNTGKETVIPAPARIEALAVQNGNIYLAGKEELFLYNTALKLIKKYRWNKTPGSGAVTGLGIERRFAWLTSGNLLVRLRLNNGKITRYPLTFSDAQNSLRVFPGKRHVWLFTPNEDNVLRFGKKNKQVLSLTDYGLDFDGASLYIKDVLDEEDFFLLAGNKRIYMLHKKSLELKRGCYIFGSQIKALARYGDSYFLAAEDGSIYRLGKKHLLENGFSYKNIAFAPPPREHGKEK